YIPGHGTPTVILVGRNRLVSSRYSGQILGILGIRGEPSTPTEPSNGIVWSAIADQIRRPGSESEWISSTYLDREELISHPWSLSGGGAVDLKRLIEAKTGQRLSSTSAAIGFLALTREDDVYLIGTPLARRLAGDTRTAPL